MKPFTFCLLPLLLTLPLSAQRTLERSDLYNEGDSIERKGVVWDTNAETAGEGITWDFSSAGFESNRDHTLSYIPLADSPEGASLDGVTHAAKYLPEDPATQISYRYWALTADSSDLVKIDDPNLFTTILFDTPVKTLAIPMNFGDAFSEDLNSNLGAYNTMSVYDAYGTLITPFGTFTNTIRIKNVQTLSFGTSPTVITSYTWYAPNQNLPVAVYTKTTGLLASQTGSISNVSGSVALADHSRYVPHVTALAAEGGYETNFLLHNPTDAIGELELQPFDAAGNHMSLITVSLAANELRKLHQSDLFDTGVSHFSIGGCESCTVTAAYSAVGINGGAAHVHETGPMGTDFFVYPGDWSALYDGMALINVGDEVAQLTGTMLDANGLTVGAPTNFGGDLAPNAKALKLFNFEFDETAISVIRVQSTQPVAVMFLRLSQNDEYLYQNNPLFP